MADRSGTSRAAAVVAVGLAAILLPGVSLAQEITLPGADQQPLPTLPPCKRSKKVACVPLTSPSQAASGLAKLTSNAKVRRGFGLAPLKRLFGKHSAAKAQRADTKFAKEASDTLFAGASSAAQFGGGDQIGQSLGADQALRNGRTRQRRSLRMEIAVDQCPDPGRKLEQNGSAKVQGRAKYRLAAREPRVWSPR